LSDAEAAHLFAIFFSAKQRALLVSGVLDRIAVNAIQQHTWAEDKPNTQQCCASAGKKYIKARPVRRADACALANETTVRMLTSRAQQTLAMRQPSAIKAGTVHIFCHQSL
jgi:hypothetical protein